MGNVSLYKVKYHNTLTCLFFDFLIFISSDNYHLFNCMIEKFISQNKHINIELINIAI